MSFTVTATEGGSTFAGVLLVVKVLTGISGSPIGNTATLAQPSGGGALQTSITTTAVGSQVYAASAYVGIQAYVGNGNTTTLADQPDATNGLETGAGRSTSATSSPGAISIGFSPTPAGNGTLALLEILPSGTITEDGSSPAAIYSGSGATTVTTASFAPPAGSLLVAMIGADANASTTMGVTDTSGLGLTWTARVTAQASGALYAAVWTAAIPAGGTNAPAGLPASSGAVGANAGAVSIGMTIRGS